MSSYRLLLAVAFFSAIASAQEPEPEPEPSPDGGVAPPSHETVVVGTPETQTAGSTHTIGGARLKRFELDDVHAVLQAVPGVQVRGEDGFGLRPNIGLRGANPNRSIKVTLMEDGVLFGPAPYSAPAAYYFPLVTRMEAVRVVKGPGAIVYGPQTVGGAIDFITRDMGPGISAGLDVALGQYWYGKGHGFLAVGNDTTSVLLELVHLRSDGFKELDGGGNTGFGRTEAMLKARHRFTVGGLSNAVTLKLGISGEDSHETYLGLSDADFRENSLRRYVSSANDHMQWLRTQVVLSHRLEGAHFSLDTALYRHDFDRSWNKLNRFRGAAVGNVLTNPESPRNQVYLGVLKGELDSSSAGEALLIGPNKRTFVSQGIQSVLRAGFTTGPLAHALEVRARYHYDSVARLHTEDAFVMRDGALVHTGEPTETLVRNFDQTHAVAFAVTDAVRWGPVTLTPGVRVELINSSTHNLLTATGAHASTNVVLPGVGGHVAITESLGALAGIYRGFSPPAPGVPDAPPELAMNVEAGARWARGRHERVELIGFFNDYANLTNICTFSTGCVTQDVDQQSNVGRALIYGLEAYAEKRWRLGPVTLPTSLAYTLSGSQLMGDTRSSDPTIGNALAGDELAYVPRHTLNATAGVEVWKVNAHVQFTFIDRMREVAGHGDFVDALTTDAQLLLDLHLGFAVTDWAQLYFDARNLFDGRFIAGRRPFGARPNAPRTLLGGLKLTW